MKEIRKYTDLFYFAKRIIEHEGEDIGKLESEFYFDVQEIFRYFANNTYLGLVDSKIKPTDKLKKEMGTDPDMGPVEEWIDEWRSLFPEGKNSNGYRFRGDRGGCISKMKKFIKNNSGITKDEIINATKNYVKKLYQGTPIKLAHYFIYKDGVSDLLAEIEDLKENNEKRDEGLDWAQ